MEYKESILKRVNGELEVVKAPPLLERGELGDVVAIRSDADNSKCTNIRWVLGRWHECAGFEWGYAGQGPTDFARNILMHFTEDREFFEAASSGILRRVHCRHASGSGLR